MEVITPDMPNSSLPLDISLASLNILLFKRILEYFKSLAYFKIKF